MATPRPMTVINDGGLAQADAGGTRGTRAAVVAERHKYSRCGRNGVYHVNVNVGADGTRMLSEIAAALDVRIEFHNAFAVDGPETAHPVGHMARDISFRYAAREYKGVGVDLYGSPGRPFLLGYSLYIPVIAQDSEKLEKYADYVKDTSKWCRCESLGGCAKCAAFLERVGKDKVEYLCYDVAHFFDTERILGLLSTSAGVTCFGWDVDPGVYCCGECTVTTVDSESGLLAHHWKNRDDGTVSLWEHPKLKFDLDVFDVQTLFSVGGYTGYRLTLRKEPLVLVPEIEKSSETGKVAQGIGSELTTIVVENRVDYAAVDLWEFDDFSSEERVALSGVLYFDSHQGLRSLWARWSKDADDPVLLSHKIQRGLFLVAKLNSDLFLQRNQDSVLVSSVLKVQKAIAMDVSVEVELLTPFDYYGRSLLGKQFWRFYVLSLDYWFLYLTIILLILFSETLFCIPCRAFSLFCLQVIAASMFVWPFCFAWLMARFSWRKEIYSASTPVREI